jgi:hypothetical protein
LWLDPSSVEGTAIPVAKQINVELPNHIANKQSSNPTRRPSSRPDRTTASGNKTKRTCHAIAKRFRRTADAIKDLFRPRIQLSFAFAIPSPGSPLESPQGCFLKKISWSAIRLSLSVHAKRLQMEYCLNCTDRGFPSCQLSADR